MRVDGGRFRDRLQDAAEWGVLTGVKWAIVVALVLLSVTLLLGDYNTVRERSANGELAWEWIQQEIKATQHTNSMEPNK